MKTKTPLFWVAAIGLALSFTACNEEEKDVIEDPVITTEEAALVVEGSVVLSTEGLAREASDAAIVGLTTEEKSFEGCGMTRDTSLERDFQGTLYSASYATSWSWTVNCNESDIPQSISFQRSAEGTYTSPFIFSEDSMSSDWLIEGLRNAPEYVLSGTYTRAGNQESQVGDRSYSTELEVSVSSLVVDKKTDEISSGSADFTLEATAPRGNDVTYTGTINFLGNRTAQIIINGTVREVNW